ncbi:hypothetical protein [Geofilum rubicundum]|uniref:Zinc ABC transporter, periplasmic-binding protein ZnuA n=1 Tax=Geofilum rubicundum JCM 15548 TaxID=1236989 RepID=A0A0E9LX07_9BACT|nr:hypothetical protein [Geofilum rubicundum]GAO29661.1 hypothetical protein JCM15548_11873 [Geofilum rubicundum JCM 15548]
MKLRIYSILLLLAFLAALSHEMIPHHHHDLDNSVLSLRSTHPGHHHSSSDFDHLHHGEGNHHHDSEDADASNFPFHQHLSADGDFDYFRINFNKDVQVPFSTVAVLSRSSNVRISPPPEMDLIRFSDKPFLITSIFKPGAIGLRAPPSMA